MFERMVAIQRPFGEKRYPSDGWRQWPRGRRAAGKRVFLKKKRTTFRAAAAPLSLWFNNL